VVIRKEDVDLSRHVDFMVRRAKVKATLEYRIAHDPDYADLIIDHNVLRQLGLLPIVSPTTITLLGSRRSERLCYRQSILLPGMYYLSLLDARGRLGCIHVQLKVNSGSVPHYSSPQSITPLMTEEKRLYTFNTILVDDSDDSVRNVRKDSTLCSSRSREPDASLGAKLSRVSIDGLSNVISCTSLAMTADVFCVPSLQYYVR
jgi:hypothetical protein